MKQYQKDICVKRHVITKEWKTLWNILNLIPKDVKIFSIACAEGFDLWMAKKRGHTNIKGLEFHKDKVVRGRKNLSLGSDILHGDIFEKLGLIEKANCFIVSRFWHNISEEEAKVIMNKIDEKRDYLIISKYKPGLLKENGVKRQPLATKKGLSNFFSLYDLVGKSFPQEFIVVGKGKYKDVPDMLREHIKGEGV